MSTCTLSASPSIRALGVTHFNVIRPIALRGLRTRVNVGESSPEGAKGVEDAEGTKGGRPRMKTIERMPFQTFQLALDIINKDRQGMLKRISEERETMNKLIKYKGLTHKNRRIISMKQQIEKWQLYSDANNPRVKYNFDCGKIGMNKPIYLHLLNKKWRQRNRPILMQRLETMHVIPDVLPNINPITDVRVHFKGRKVQPGLILDSLMVEEHPTVRVIPFKNEEMLCTIVVVDPDVPDPKMDRFRYRCHWIVSNIPISPMQTTAVGYSAKPADTIVPYLPPHAQKGAPYHRYAMIVFKQPEKMDTVALEGKVDRDKFTMRGFQDKNKLHPIGAFMWRVEWDSHTKEIMQKHNLPGWDIMYKRIKDVVLSQKKRACI